MYTTLSIRTKLFLIVLSLSCLFSCKKWIDIPPPNDFIISEVMFSDEILATGAVSGIYGKMMGESGLFSNSGTTIYAGMCADELRFFFNNPINQFAENQILLSMHDSISNLFWEPAYNVIYTTNLCLEKIGASTGIPAFYKRTLMGECYFLRAFTYFHLVNLFGPVPLCVVSDWRITSKLGRAPVNEIYDRIISDLLIAQATLPENYDSIYGGGGKGRATKWAATALLARVYLYRQNWSAAEQQASSVINSLQFNLVANLNDVFLTSSTEAIWQLYPVKYGINTWEGNLLITPSNVFPSFIVIPQLLQSFEALDQRKQDWIGKKTLSGNDYYYPAKYKIMAGIDVTEYYMALRLAEQYLIRAEARAHQDKLQEALSDVNIIRNRAGLPEITDGNQQEVLNIIEQERRSEFFAEWGHRWYDLKRTDRANAVLSFKPNWQSTDQLWPIPNIEIRKNIYLTQNPGY